MSTRFQKGHIVPLKWRKKVSETQKGNKNTLGKHWKSSEETKRKISEGLKGNKNFLGKHHSKEIRKRISEANKGEKCKFWEGGITPENKKIRRSIEFRLWREAVFARDNWICQRYGVRGIKLHPHHIQNFSHNPELRFAIDNGITLSEMAHREFHRHFGKTNNTKEQLEEFLR